MQVHRIGVALRQDERGGLGGRLQIEGGASSQSFNGRSSTAGIRRARIEIGGRAAKGWFYRLQYEFGTTIQNSTVFTPIGIAGCGSATYSPCGGGNITSIPSYSALGGIRDAYLGTNSPLLTTPLSKYPAWITVSNHFEPNSHEAVGSSKYITFLERSLATDTFAAARHIGASIGLRGDIWTWKGGIYSTSVEDKSLAPPASTGAPFVWAVGTSPSNCCARHHEQKLRGDGRRAILQHLEPLHRRSDHGRGSTPPTSAAGFAITSRTMRRGPSDDRVMTLGARRRPKPTLWVRGSRRHAGSVLRLRAPELRADGRSRRVGRPSRFRQCAKDVEVFGFETACATAPLDRGRGSPMITAARAKCSMRRRRPPPSPRPSAGPRQNGVYVPGGSNADFTGFLVPLPRVLDRRVARGGLLDQGSQRRGLRAGEGRSPLQQGRFRRLGSRGANQLGQSEQWTDQRTELHQCDRR